MTEKITLTQLESFLFKAAKLLGIKQPNVSALMKGHLDGLSAERLFRFLNKLDKSIEIVIKDKPRQAKNADVRVVVDAA